MIVKNEQDYLEDCLRSVRDVADEIIILDTGSTDKTLEIAKMYKAKIHTFKWLDDFSAARNESIKYAKSDWILWLDADERLQSDSVPKLKTLLKPETKPVAYILQIWNMMADGKNYKISGAHRLFTNHKDIQFSGRIHEQIVHSLAELSGEERKCSVTLNHLGYGLNERDQAHKNKRNRELLLRMVKEEPTNAYAHYTLAQNYSLTFEWQMAYRHYKKAMQFQHFNLDMEVSLLNTFAESALHLDLVDEAKQLVGKSIQKITEQVGAYYLMFRFSEKAQNAAEALKWLLKLFEMNEYVRQNGKKISTDVVIDPDDLIFEIIQKQEQLRQPSEAIFWINQISDRKQRNPDIVFKQATYYTQLNEFDRAEKILKESVLQENFQAKELLGMLYIKKNKLSAAIEIYEQLFEKAPKEKVIIKRLAGLYAKTGEEEKTLSLVEYLNTL